MARMGLLLWVMRGVRLDGMNVREARTEVSGPETHAHIIWRCLGISCGTEGSLVEEAIRKGLKGRSLLLAKSQGDFVRNPPQSQVLMGPGFITWIIVPKLANLRGLEVNNFEVTEHIFFHRCLGTKILVWAR